MNAKKAVKNSSFRIDPPVLFIRFDINLGSPRSPSARDLGQPALVGFFPKETLKPLDEGEGFVELGKERLVGLELARMDAAAQSAQLDGVLQVQHLVEEQVFDGVAGAGGAVEDAADDDGVVGGVVVAQGTLGDFPLQVSSGRPSKPLKKRVLSESKTSSRW